MSKRLPITLNSEDEKNIKTIQDRLGLESRSAAVRWGVRYAAGAIATEDKPWTQSIPGRAADAADGRKRGERS